MGRLGTCAGGCGELKLKLVPADQYERLAGEESSCHVCAEALRAVVENFIRRRPKRGDWEAAYRSAQDLARVTLRRHPAREYLEIDRDGPLDYATAWWCAECGGIDAPQPCLAVCVWRSIEWVNVACFLERQAAAHAERDVEQDLRALVHRIASITPRAGHWERGWRALQGEAQEVIHASTHDARTHQSAAPVVT
jgi:hypothetical protein